MIAPGWEQHKALVEGARSSDVTFAPSLRVEAGLVLRPQDRAGICERVDALQLAFKCSDQSREVAVSHVNFEQIEPRALFGLREVEPNDGAFEPLGALPRCVPEDALL